MLDCKLYLTQFFDDAERVWFRSVRLPFAPTVGTYLMFGDDDDGGFDFDVDFCSYSVTGEFFYCYDHSGENEGELTEEGRQWGIDGGWRCIEERHGDDRLHRRDG